MINNKEHNKGMNFQVPKKRDLQTRCHRRRYLGITWPALPGLQWHFSSPTTQWKLLLGNTRKCVYFKSIDFREATIKAASAKVISNYEIGFIYQFMYVYVCFQTMYVMWTRLWILYGLEKSNQCSGNTLVRFGNAYQYTKNATWGFMYTSLASIYTMPKSLIKELNSLWILNLTLSL